MREAWLQKLSKLTLQIQALHGLSDLCIGLGLSHLQIFENMQ